MVATIMPIYNIAPLFEGVICDSDLLPNLLLINDGSTDGSDIIIKKNGLRSVDHEVNKGKGAALITGFKEHLKNSAVTGILTIDGDGQHALDDAKLFIEAHKINPHKLLVGNRWHGKQRAPFARQMANRFSTWLIKRMSREKVIDSQCGYRLYPRKFIEKVIKNLPDGRFETETLLLLLAGRLKLPIENIPIKTFYSSETIRLSKYRGIYDSARIAKVLYRSITHQLD